MLNQNSSDIQNRNSLLNNTPIQIYDYLIRRSDLDDVDFISKFINSQQSDKLNLLYDYPSIVKLFQRSLISVTIIDKNHKIIGAACFNDSPPGFRGKVDFVHQNLWQDWLFKAYNIDDFQINSYNTLWLTFMTLEDSYAGEYPLILQRVFQNIYSFLPNISGILFLKRGQLQGQEFGCQIFPAIKKHFMKFRLQNQQILKNLIGINHKSDVYYSTKLKVTENLEIRMARQQDHDDLAQIFNRQSEVLTSQFGQFFIANLIATQNLTRRITKGSKSEGKAIVGQVKDKAVGLMSISTEIDYKLLNNCFQLGVYDNLLKQDFIQSVNNRYDQIKLLQKWEKEDQRQRKLKLIQQERIKCLKIGQRILLQQFCCDKQLEIKTQIETLLSNQQQFKLLNKNSFLEMVDKWMSPHTLPVPSQLFKQFPQYAKDLSTYIINSSEFLIQTLELFGLPKNYIYGNGHWKDWAKRILDERKTAILRRPQKKAPKRIVKKKGKQQKKEDDQLKPPVWFDINPFNAAFAKFVSVNAQIRTAFRQEVQQKIKKVIILFCDENGQMIKQNSVDLLTLGKTMNEVGITVSQQILQNMHCVLEAFGQIKYQDRTIQVAPKEDQDTKKKKKPENEVPKLIDVNQKLTSYQQFSKAIKQLKQFDTMLTKLGYLKSMRLQAQVKQLLQKQALQKEALLAKRQKIPNLGKYQNLVNQIQAGQLPDIPYQAQNAIVINLFCADQIYQSRSIDFVEFAFSLFPDRDYIILTQPFTVPQSTLLQNFIQAPKKKNSTFEHCLYILHRDSLLASNILVRKATAEDFKKSIHLISGMINSDKIKSDINDSIVKTNSKLITFSVYCGQQIIGIYVVSKNVNLQYYVSHFFVQDHIILNQHPRQNHSKLVHSILNPLFVKSTRFILKQIMRLTNKSCLYFEVHQRTLLPDIFNEFVLVRARIFPHFLKRKWDFQFEKQDLQRRLHQKGAIDQQRDAYDEQQPPFSLSIITKKLLSSNKISNNNRIVVVGASDTGISFIQSLLMIKQINFTNITLLAPGGLTTMHAKKQKDLLKSLSTNYTLQQLRNLMIDARTTVLDAKMVKLDKKNKNIMIDKNAFVPFDILVISVGLIDTLLQNQGLISYGLSTSPYYKDKKYINGVYSIDDPYLYREFEFKSKNISLLKRKKKPHNITIYGRTPHTLAFISGLLQRGVNPKRIYFVTPNPTRPRKRTFSSNQQRLVYEDSLINDPDTFEDANVEKIIFEELKKMGINIYLGFEFHNIVGNPCQGIKFRRKADNYDELQQAIKKKKNQIQLKLQQIGNKIIEQNDSQLDDAEQKISPEKEIELLMQQQYIQIQTPSNYFVTSGLIDIDKEIFNIIHENGLVYNGRLIVKSNFQTTENQIFACGKICEFSQRYKNYSIGKSLRLDKYNGRELGNILSKHILQKLDLSYLITLKYSQEELPKLYMPVGIGGALLRKMVYYFIKKNDYSQPKIVYVKEKQTGKQFKQVLSNNIKNFEGHYIRFLIDNNGLIDSVSYLGSQEVVVQSLTSFVGLSIKYLNKLISRYEHGLIPNISQFLSQNWAICLYHELFSEFRHYIKNQILSNQSAERVLNRASEKAKEGEWLQESFYEQIKSIIPKELFASIKQGTLQFISRNTNHLPMYYIPSRKMVA